jgi:hypothetical protein
MAFDRNGLYVAHPGVPAGHRIWTYATLDTAATVDTAGYFNSASKELAIGDTILVKVVTGSVKTPTGITAQQWLFVNANAAGVVDTSDGSAIAATDTD